MVEAEVVVERPRLPVAEVQQLQPLVAVVAVAERQQQLAQVLRPSGLLPPELDR